MIPSSHRLLSALGIRDTDCYMLRTGFCAIDGELGGGIRPGEVLLYTGEMSYYAAVYTGALHMLVRQPEPNIVHFSGIGRDNESIDEDYAMWAHKPILRDYLHPELRLSNPIDIFKTIRRKLRGCFYERTLVITYADGLLDYDKPEESCRFYNELVEHTRPRGVSLVIAFSFEHSDDIDESHAGLYNCLYSLADVNLRIQSMPVRSKRHGWTVRASLGKTPGGLYAGDLHGYLTIPKVNT